MDKQLQSWNKDYANFYYDAYNGRVNILNAQQLQSRAKHAKAHTTNRAYKARMTRLIHQTKKDPHMYRVENVWDKNPKITDSRGSTTKTQSEWNQLDNITTAYKGHLLRQVANQWNKMPENKHNHIIFADQAGLKPQSDTWNVAKYPQIQNKSFQQFLNGQKYYNGLKETTNYIRGNYPTRANSLINNMKTNFSHFKANQKYNATYKRMRKAERSRKYDTPLKYYENTPTAEYGAGNDQIDVGPDEPIVTPYEDGIKAYHRDRSYLDKIQAQDKQRSQQAKQEPKQHFSIGNHIEVQGIGFGSPDKDRKMAQQTKQTILKGLQAPHKLHHNFSSQLRHTKHNQSITSKPVAQHKLSKKQMMMRKQNGQHRN